MRGHVPSALQARLAAGELRAYVVARPTLLPSLDLAPRGFSVRPEHIFDPTRAATSPFLDRIERLDALVFAPRGLATPRWALYDCACLPGVIFGLGAPAAALDDATRSALGIGAPAASLDDATRSAFGIGAPAASLDGATRSAFGAGETAAPDDLVPLSSLVAIPMLGDDRWLAYALAVAPVASALPHLADVTLALGIDLLRAREITATAQWSSPELDAFASAAPLHVLAASLPSHDIPDTAVLRLRAPTATSTPTAANAASTPITASTLTTVATSSRHHCAESSPTPRTPSHASALHLANPHLLRDLEPFVVATPDHLARLDLAPFGLSIAADARIDPLAPNAAPFLDRLARLDALTFGPEGMPMPRWLFLDGAALPAGIVGFARRAAALDDEARALLAAPDDPAALVPFAMYIAVPSHDPGTFIGHNLASIAERLPSQPLHGLGRLTKAVALAVYRAAAQIGATQWASRALHVHARLGPLALLSAWTPAHRDPATLTYRATLDEPALRHLAGDPAGHIAEPAPDFWIDSADHAAMRSLQDRIECGERFCVCGPPETIAPGRRRVPVARDRPLKVCPE